MYIALCGGGDCAGQGRAGADADCAGDVGGRRGGLGVVARVGEEGGRGGRGVRSGFDEIMRWNYIEIHE